MNDLRFCISIFQLAQFGCQVHTTSTASFFTEPGHSSMSKLSFVSSSAHSVLFRQTCTAARASHYTKKKKSEFGLQQEHPKSYNEVTRHPIEIHLNLTSLKNQSILSGEKKHIETASKLV